MEVKYNKPKTLKVIKGELDAELAKEFGYNEGEEGFLFIVAVDDWISSYGNHHPKGTYFFIPFTESVVDDEWYNELPAEWK